MLAERMRRHGAQAWLVNTGWSGGPYGVGRRMPIRATRAIIDGIHSGDLRDVPTVEDPLFGLQIPTHCPGVPAEILQPRNTWDDREAYDATAARLADLFRKNFAKYAPLASNDIRQAGPCPREAVSV